jgi:predicted RNA binding protein YcfA (HicA-like mRNA interferase family)
MQRTNNLPKYAKQFKKILEERDWVTVALKGSEDLELNKEQMACFECYQ